MSDEKYKDFLIIFSNLINPVFVEKGMDLAFKRFKKLIKDHVFIINLIFLKNSLINNLSIISKAVKIIIPNIFGTPYLNILRINVKLTLEKFTFIMYNKHIIP